MVNNTEKFFFVNNLLNKLSPIWKTNKNVGRNEAFKRYKKSLI